MSQIIMNTKTQKIMVLLEEEISTLPQRMKLPLVYGELKLFVYLIIWNCKKATNQYIPKRFILSS